MKFHDSIWDNPKAPRGATRAPEFWRERADVYRQRYASVYRLTGRMDRGWRTLAVAAEARAIGADALAERLEAAAVRGCGPTPAHLSTAEYFGLARGQRA